MVEEEGVVTSAGYRKWNRVVLPLLAVLLVVVVGLLGGPMLAFAQDPDPGHTGGIWIAHTPGNTSNFSGEGTNRIYWGTAAQPGGQQSSYEFVGAALPNPMPLNTSFVLGTFTHYNFPIHANYPLQSATLSVAIDFEDPAWPDQTFSYVFAHEETPNSGTCAYCGGLPPGTTCIPCPDRVTFPTAYGEESFRIGDQLYTLKIDGFRRQISDPTMEYFVTQENEANSAYLYATVSSVLVPEPAISIIKETSGDQSSWGDGVYIAAGAPVYWRYIVQNTGNVELTGISVTDDKGLTVSCPYSTLAPGASMTCTASGTAVAGLYSNIGTVTGTPPEGTNVTASDPSHYYGAELTATKTAVGSYDRTITWTLEKTVDPASHSGYAGAEAGSSTWTVVATKAEDLGNYQVTGDIIISNPTPIDVEFSVADTLSDGTEATVTCPTYTVPAAVDTVPGSVTCTYTASPINGTATKNTAVITPITPGVAGATATAGVTFTANLIGYDSGTLSDERFVGAPWNYAAETISGNTTRTFAEKFSCPSDPNLYKSGAYKFTQTNTAVLNGGINLSASASVEVTCTLQPLAVTKDAAGTYDRTVTWTLAKSVDPASHSGVAGETFDSTWTVTATKSEVSDNYEVTGTITITNPAAVAQSFTVSDVLSDGTSATVICPVTNDNTGTVPAAVGNTPGSVQCTYTASPSDASAASNTVTVTAPGNPPQSDTRPVAFTANLIGYDSGTLSDQRFEGDPWRYAPETISATTTKSFNETFACSTDAADYANGGSYSYTEPNTAYLNGSINLQASASVNVTCTMPRLQVEKTATGTYDRTVTWTLAKSVTPASHSGFAGDTFNSTWSVVATKSESLGNYKVTGTITITNPGAVAQSFTISDVLDDGTVATVRCPAYTVPAAVAGVPGKVECTYSAAPTAGSATLNTVTVSVNGYGDVTATAPVSFTENLVGYDSGTLSDARFSYSKQISASTTETFPETFSCPDNPSLYVDGTYTFTETNTAVLNDKINLSASASVDVTCTMPRLQVEKTATGAYDRTVTWTLAKSVSPASHSGFAGDTFNSTWSVVATKSESLGNYKVTGTITITNPGAVARSFTISDVLNDGTVATVSCPAYTVPANDSIVCTYSAAPTAGSATLNTVTVSAAGNADVTATAPVSFIENLIGFDRVTVDDDRDTEAQFPAVISKTTTFDYDETFTCSSAVADYSGLVDSDSYANKATIAETSQFDEASVQVTCYIPTIAKTAAGTYDERHEWAIEKSVSPESQSGFIGDVLSYEWKVVVTEDTYEENFEVAGTITVTNPNPDDAMTVAVSDVLGNGTAATITDCTGDADLSDGLTVAAGGNSVCNYTASVLGITAVGDAPVLNTATLTLNNIDFDADATIGWTPNVIRGSVELNDDQNPAFPITITEGGSWTYGEDYTCSTDRAQYGSGNSYTFSEDNVAVVSDGATTLDDATATASIACYVPAVSKTAEGTYTKTHNWAIEKTVNPASQAGSPGDVLPWTWTVKVSETPSNSDFAVSGEITVVNPNGQAELAASLSDQLNDGTVGAISGCTGGTYDGGILTVPAGGTAVCGYSALPSGLASTNVATVTLNRIPFSGQATVRWTPSISNGTATVTDGQIGLNEVVTAGEGPWIRTGSGSHTCAAEDSGQYAATGSYGATVDNTATVTGSNGQTASADASTKYVCSIQAMPAIEIEKATNGEDADVAPGPYIPEGGAVTWRYVVTNTGNVDLTDVAVTDNMGVIPVYVSGDVNDDGILQVDETWVYEATGTAIAGQYENLGAVTAAFAATGETVSDSDPSHYFGSAPAIEIEKATNGEDADAAPGPYIPEGDPVTWTYVVTNTGNVTLTDVAVTDDQGVVVSCPQTTLAVGESMTCTASGIAVAGQYANIGTVSGTPPVGAAVTDSDPSHYYGLAAGIDIEKATNGEDADTATGPYIKVGDAVSWTYVVTNTSNVELTNVTVSDDQGVVVSCPKTTLAASESMTCTASGTAVAGQYANIGTVTGTTPAQTTVTDSDPSHYFGSEPSIDIEKATNGEDADTAPGPYIKVGDAVSWTYVVTNTGNVALTDVAVTDDQGVVVSCPQTTLAVGESMTCTASGIAVAGQYANIGTVSGTPPVGAAVTDSDPSHYYGLAAGIDIEKATNGEDADTAPGPYIPVGDAVTWTYVVTNTGNVTLTDVAVSDDQLGAVSCPKTTLAASESMTCTASGTAVAGQYANIGTATGTTPAQTTVTDSDPSHYFGSAPAIEIEKATNGEDADAAPGPYIPEGDPVTWTYVVTNTGNVTLTDVAVTDDQGVVVSCPQTTLAVGESMTCTASGIAVAGQYANIGTVSGTPPVGAAVSDEDPSHYFGSAPAIEIEKATNGEDADTAPGPKIPLGDPVTWTYVVTNTGNVDLTEVAVTDDRGVVVSCPQTTLAVGESMTCTGSGVAVAGQYVNEGTAVGSFGEVQVSDSDPSHYYGVVGGLKVTKEVELLQDAAQVVDPNMRFEICASGPSFSEPSCVQLKDGESHTWTGLIPGSYVVSETAPVHGLLSWAVEVVYEGGAEFATVVAEETAEVTVLNTADYQSPPTGIMVSEWEATVGQSGVLHTWRTIGEEDVSGFRVYRGSVGSIGEAELVGEVVAQGPSVYQWVDGEVSLGTWYYWLVEVDSRGEEGESIGPKTVTVGLGGQDNRNQRIYLPMTMLRG